MDEEILKVSGVTKTYSNGAGIFDVNMEIGECGVYGLLGENGAGKTTLMSVITGYMGVNEGDITICGHDILKETVAAKGEIGYLPEVPPLYEDMTVREYLCFVAELKGLKKDERDERVEYAIGHTELESVEDRLIKNLSKGFRQRVGFAQAIIKKSRLIVLDEPTSGLDPAQIAQTRNLILSLKEDHAIILSSHILSEIEGVCDTLFIISEGRLVFNGKLDELEKDGSTLEEAFLRLTGHISEKTIDKKPQEESDDSDL